MLESEQVKQHADSLHMTRFLVAITASTASHTIDHSLVNRQRLSFVMIHTH